MKKLYILAVSLFTAEGEIVRLKDAQLNKKEEIKQANKALQDLESKQGEYK